MVPRKRNDLDSKFRKRMCSTPDSYGRPFGCPSFVLKWRRQAKDWYATTFHMISTSTWDAWRKFFTEYFATNGWAEPVYTVNYKFIGGSFNECVIRKLKLLSDVNPALPENWRILLVVAGVPVDSSYKIDKDKCTSVSDLISKINQLDGMPGTNKSLSKDVDKNNTNNNGPSKKFNPKYKPCSFCEKIGKPGRYHPESECKTRLNPPTRKFSNTKSSSGEKNIKLTNNAEMEKLLNEEANSKN